MATLNLQPPGSLFFHKAEDWPKWIRRFEQYRLASGLSEKAEERQVSTLLYCLGENAEDVLDTTRISVENKKKYDRVVEEFANYFKVRKNVIYERARFNKRNQLSGESVEEFITEVHRLGDSCDFGGMKEDLIRDRLVVGIRDQALSERLQMEPDLTLDKAKRLIRQRDAVKEQQQALKLPIKEESTLDAVSKKNPKRILPAIPSQQKLSQANCRRCGRGSHSRQFCPAREARCNRKGHYGAQCQSNTIAELTAQVNQTEVSYQETAYLDTIEVTDRNMWEVKIDVEDKSVRFKVDTGAEVTVLSDSTWKSLKLSTPLRKARISLCGPDQSSLMVIGEATLCLSYQGKSSNQNQGKSSNQNVFIVKNLKNNLLGLPAIRALQLFSNVCAVDKSIISQYPSLFSGLGKFGNN